MIEHAVIHHAEANLPHQFLKAPGTLVARFLGGWCDAPTHRTGEERQRSRCSGKPEGDEVLNLHWAPSVSRPTVIKPRSSNAPIKYSMLSWQVSTAVFPPRGRVTMSGHSLHVTPTARHLLTLQILSIASPSCDQYGSERIDGFLLNSLNCL